MKKIVFITLLTAFATGLFTSCENGDWEFPDYEYSTVYFAYQSPIRTICLGEDVFDTSLDNEFKCQIMATMGGVYSNDANIEIGIRVDNSLCNNLAFDESDTDILPMPSTYYTLSSDKITIEKGSILGGVTVQLTQAFFNDPQSLDVTYVIPVVMTSVTNADSILSGIPLVDNPRRGVSADWDVQPKDYILYAVKYINPYDANYLRRGKDIIQKDGSTQTAVRHKEYVEKDEVVKWTTRSFKGIEFPLNFFSRLGHNLDFSLNVDFDDNQKCTVTAPFTAYSLNDSIRVFNVSASGSGEFVEKGDKKSWGNVDRNVIYLNYNIAYQVEITFPEAGLPTDFQTVNYTTTDTLVVRDRGLYAEWFTPVLKD